MGKVNYKRCLRNWLERFTVLLKQQANGLVSIYYFSYLPSEIPTQQPTNNIDYLLSWNMPKLLVVVTGRLQGFKETVIFQSPDFKGLIK